MNCILKRQFLFSTLCGTLLNTENSQNPIDKCIIGEKGQNGDESFTSVTRGWDWDSGKKSLDFKVKLLDYP